MDSYLHSIVKQFEYYKSLGDKTFSQLTFKELQYTPNSYSNSISIITKHIAGNMLSRWTNFLTEDGEKEWRHRDQEFESTFASKEELIKTWENGWICLLEAIKSLTLSDLERIVYIRNQGHTVIEAINRQLAHYSYHVGQIVFVGTLIKKGDWQSLSIPKGSSSTYNKNKFSKPKTIKHFTDDL
ncbi:DUF1572 family protein [uncultured Lacinutrix sp.]|uniref:DUF1572 family protein n=1 Tax=uncultured Lacinutrix sp. TaxID=574032 RepID=UPI0026226EE0|nr:DUF1572 family protein [uncultured Lacinutrix sp.]